MFSNKLIYTFIALILASVVTGGCSSRHDSEPEIIGDPVTLTLRIAPVGSRAEGESPSKSDYMKQLRVVILKGDRVLYNNCYSLGGDVSEAQTLLYKVNTGDNLKIYLLANCEDIDIYEDESFSSKVNISDLSDDKSKNIFLNGKIDNLVFKSNIADAASTYVPMTNCYDITIPTRDRIPEDGKYTWPEPLFVVRTCNKLTVSFTNHSDQPIKILSYSLSKINTSGQTFLLPNVSQESWFETLKATATNTNIPATTGRWIYDYKVPSGTRNEVYTFSVDQGSALDAPVATGNTLSDLSRLIPETKKTEKMMAGIMQTYEFSVVTDKGTFSTTSLDPTYLENLYSLFRNTSVYINVSFNQSGFEVDVQPYQEYEIGVDFGLQRNNIGDLMVVRDQYGNFSSNFYKYIDSYTHRKLTPVMEDLGAGIVSNDSIALQNDDYYAIHVGTDGDIYSADTQLWVMDSDGCRVISNFAIRDGASDACSSRLVWYFPTTSPDTYTIYRKDKEHDIRLQHHADHSCVVLRIDGKMYFKNLEDGEYVYLPVESWEGNWDGNNSENCYAGVFYVEIEYNGEVCYRKYSEEGIPQDELIYPDGRVGYIYADGSENF